MGRSHEEDIAMRETLNKVIDAVNSGATYTDDIDTSDAGGKILIDVWKTYFQGREIDQGDYDSLKSLVTLMVHGLSGYAHTVEAQDFLARFEDKHRLKVPYYALYDLSRHPPQYDFICFLAQAKTLAEHRPLHVVFLPGQDGRYVKYNKYSNDEAIYRMEHICLPACILYGVTCTVLPHRNSPQPEGEWLNGLNAGHDGIMNVVDRFGNIFRPQATRRAVELVGRYAVSFEKPIVTITLRSTFRNESRNSNKEIWFEVADKIRDRYQPIFVPDTAEAFDIWDHSYPVFPIGAVDLDSRLALYEHAAMNFFSSNGPGALGWFGKIPFISFGVRAESYQNEAEWERLRLPVGSQPPYFLERQKIVWEQPDADMVLREFSAIMPVS